MTYPSYNSSRYSSALLPDWLNPGNNTQSIAPLFDSTPAIGMVSDTGLGSAGTDLSSLGSMGGINGAAPSSLWGSFGNWMDNSGILGKKMADGTMVQGWGGLGLNAATGLMGAYTSMKQLDLSKDTLANNKAQYAQNFAAQQKTTNAQLEDRQRARVASNPTAFQSVGDYMKKNGI